VLRRHRDVEHAAVKVLADSNTLEEAAPQILESIGLALGWQFGALWLIDRKTEVIRCSTLWRNEGGQLDAFETATRDARYPQGLGLPGRIWDTGEPAWIRDVTSDSNFPRAAAATDAGLGAAVGFPITVRGELFGVIEFFSKRIQEPDEGLIALFSTIGDQIGRLIEREEMEQRLQFQTALLEAHSEAAIDGIVIMSTDGRIVHWNKRFLEIWAISEYLMQRGDVKAVVRRKAQQTPDPAKFSSMMEQLADDPLAKRRDEIRLADGRIIDRWAAPVTGDDGTLYGRAIFYRDITEQKRTEERLRDNERFYSFLAEVSSVMSRTLDYKANLERLARLTVPTLADWCAIHIIEPTGDIGLVALAHSDPEKLSFGRRVQDLFPVDPSSDVGLAAAIRSGSSYLFENITDRALESLIKGPELEQLRTLGFRSAMIIPLVCRDRVLGTLSFVDAESGRRFTKEDLRFAEELATRVAFPIDNARLYDQRAKIAQTLQESLLPPKLLEIPGVELAARYHAAIQTADVGGDFYDLFPAGERSWGLTLGDVSGKGVDAASVTSLARHTLRTATMATQRPSEILSMLNAALLDQTERDRFCTAVYALIEPRFGRVNITVSCGGHPVPYVVRSNGALEPIQGEGTLLGVVSDPELTDISTELDFGDKLILYTDGILDIRPRQREFGHAQIEELFASCSKRGVKSAADLIEKSVLELQEGRARDDFALVILGVRASIFRRARTPRLWGREGKTEESGSAP
jgi:PAS domain S-box-containing protein